VEQVLVLVKLVMGLEIQGDQEVVEDGLLDLEALVIRHQLAHHKVIQGVMQQVLQMFMEEEEEVEQEQLDQMHPYH
jgi:hypothetical protein